MATKKTDCVEIAFTGYHDGKVFDSNIQEDLKQLNPDAKAEKTLVIIGENMVVKGLDKALEGKEVGKEYGVDVPYAEGFGPRKRDMVRTIPLSVFTRQKINPRPGATLVMDNMLVRVITVSGARVITDFNNPLAGKDLSYKFTIKRIVEDETEKVTAFFTFALRMTPDIELKENKIIVKGPKPLEGVVTLYKEKAKQLFNKEIVFEEAAPVQKEAPEAK